MTFVTEVRGNSRGGHPPLLLLQVLLLLLAFSILEIRRQIYFIFSLLWTKAAIGRCTINTGVLLIGVYYGCTRGALISCVALVLCS